jgi:hypothetical protein
VVLAPGSLAKQSSLVARGRPTNREVATSAQTRKETLPLELVLRRLAESNFSVLRPRLKALLKSCQETVASIAAIW